MDQQRLKPKDLVRYLGSASKVSEVLSGQRRLSLSMIWNLVNQLGIPAEVLLQKPKDPTSGEIEIDVSFPST